MNNAFINKRVLGSLNVDSNVMYFVAFLVNFVPSFLMTSMYSTIMPIKIFYYCAYLSALILLFKMFLFDKFTPKQALFYIIAVPLLFITWKVSNSDYAFVTGMFILGARNIDFKKIIKCYLAAAIVLMIFIVFSEKIGIIRNLAYVRDGMLRQSFGIIYPTDFAAHIFFILLANFYIRFKKFSWPDYLVTFLSAIFIYYFCDARLDVICILLIIPVAYLAKRVEKNKLDFGRYIISVYWLSIPMLTVITIFVTIYYDPTNQLFLKFNEWFSGRLAYSHVGFEKYGFSWIGRRVVEHGWGGAAGMKAFSGHSGNFSYFMLDSSFIRIFLIYGSIFAVVLLIALSYRLIQCVYRGNFLIPSIIFLMVVSCFVDHHILDLSYNPFILVILASVPDTISKMEDSNNAQVIDSQRSY